MNLKISDDLSLPIEAVERFWQKVDKKGPDDCWPWKGYVRNSYHGAIHIKGKNVYVHRLSYIIYHGSAPEDKVVCHHCDVPLCVNPKHLFLGTQADNIRDMWNKKRAFYPPKHFGLSNSNAKLTDEQVSEIRELYSKNRIGQRVLAARYMVSQSTIWRLVHHKTRSGEIL